MNAPRPERRPVTDTRFDVTRVDDYAWFRDRDDPSVIAHLEAENAYTALVMAPTKGLQEVLFNEIKARVQETDESVPVRKGPWEYFTRTEEGRQYAIHGRRAMNRTVTGPATTGAAAPGSEQIVLDENELADGHEFFSLGTFEICPHHRLLAYGVDTSGAERLELRVRDLEKSSDLTDRLDNTAPGVAWSSDATQLFYATLDDTMRPDTVWRHRLGTLQTEDVQIFHEPDERFYAGVSATTTEELIVITLSSMVTTEQWTLRSAAPTDDATLVRSRRQDVEYALEHHRAVDGSERLLIVTNDGDESFRVMTASLTSPDVWGVCVTGGAPGPATGYPTKLDGIEVFREHLVLHERVDGLERIRIAPIAIDGAIGALRALEMPEPVHSVFPSGNAEYDTQILRFSYTSPVTPPSVFDLDLRTGQRVLRKRQAVLGDFDPDQYCCERLWATAPDGVMVPMSVVARRDRPTDGTGPVMLYGYGSYEISIDPTFSSIRLSLLDRGFAVAIAHVRGGGELGRRWYLDGKYLHKTHTFDDFIACGRHLVETGWGASDRLIARGGSAGGLLMGAVANRAPQLWRAIVAEVPFVDVVTTMLDESLPLTAIEWEEWGNPAEPAFFAAMHGYAPYENIADDASGYPDFLITAGLNDPRVGYWEPAKWAARLRDRGVKKVLLRTELGAGHGGPSGRYAVWRDESFVLAFIIAAAGGSG